MADLSLVEDILGECFREFKIKDSNDLGSLYSVCKLYEDLRYSLSSCDAQVFNDTAVMTGRAISNISHDLKRSELFKSLDDISMVKNTPNMELFFLGHRGGLCNRLRAIASLKVVARCLEIPFNFSWSETKMCVGGTLPTKCFASRVDSLIYRKICGLSEPIIEDESLTPWVYYKKYGHLLKISSWAEFESLYRVESAALLEELAKALSLNEEFFSFIEEFKGSGYLAVHVRRTDFVNYFKEKFPNGYLPSLDDYFCYIEKYYSTGYIFLSTDDFSVRSEFEKVFPKRLLTFDFAFDKSEARQTSFTHTVLDLLALTRADILLPTPKSSFSEYAASVSGGDVIQLWEF